MTKAEETGEEGMGTSRRGAGGGWLIEKAVGTDMNGIHAMLGVKVA